MKKLLLLMSLWVGVVSAQSLQTYSVYDTNQNGEITVSDVTEIVDKVKSNISAANTQQYVTAEDLSLALQSIQNDLKLIKEKLGIDDTPTPPAQLASFEISSKNLKVGETFTQTVTTSVDGTITYYSNNTSVATVNASTGLVKAVSQGNAIITAIIESASNQDVLSASYIINVDKANQMNGHEYVDLGLPSGVKWATCNVGATSPEDYGDYFAWGETEGYMSGKKTFTLDNYKWYMFTTAKDDDGFDFSTVGYTKYVMQSDASIGYNGFYDNKTILDLDDDAAHVNWGGDWRMPTMEEMRELYKECTWALSSLNGIKGQKVTGPNGNYIFLPAAGFHWGATFGGATTNGSYWSSSLSTGSSRNALNVYFMNDEVKLSNIDRYVRAFSVRPVCK